MKIMEPRPANSFTPERIAELQQLLREYPIDPAYDEVCEEFNDSLDSNFLLQCSVRITYNLLKSIERLPDGLE